MGQGRQLTVGERKRDVTLTCVSLREGQTTQDSVLGLLGLKFFRQIISACSGRHVGDRRYGPGPLADGRWVETWCHTYMCEPERGPNDSGQAAMHGILASLPLFLLHCRVQSLCKRLSRQANLFFTANRARAVHVTSPTTRAYTYKFADLVLSEYLRLPSGSRSGMDSWYFKWIKFCKYLISWQLI